VISDDGVGFDTARIRTTGGLGLVSMRERMQLVGGQFEIRSTPGDGTTIRARVALATKDR
jgi:two-component system, NarL family, sensor histidine kinase UhpB